MKKLTLSLIVALGLAVVGCGDDDVVPPPVDGGPTDLGQADMNTPDVDMGPETACVTAGGECVSVTPGSCTGITSTDSCGTGVGVACCLPGDGGVALDLGPATACETAGGTCVATTPGSCTGTPSSESCGPGVGTTCCLPGDGGVADGG